MFIIQDWASNCLQSNGKFNFSRYGADLGTPMYFDTFEDAAEYLDLNYSEDEQDDLYINDLNEVK